MTGLSLSVLAHILICFGEVKVVATEVTTRRFFGISLHLAPQEPSIENG